MGGPLTSRRWELEAYGSPFFYGFWPGDPSCRSATEADIKRAFRRLARELHPDVSAEPDAEERFREAVAAYEVLSKSETRGL